ncbi:hypothetical protein RMCBS344292_09466 [Rhizopus microsporus]|nr:hypothetical protein RMCBS344292_09466 [Rhizopus microsporus]
MPSFTAFPRSQTRWGHSTWTNNNTHHQKDNNDKHKSMTTTTTTTTTTTMPVKEKKKPEFQPRFSVFGSNKRTIIQDMNKKEQEEKDLIKEIPTITTTARKKKKVKFDSIFLERVCLFSETQSPQELHRVQDKQPKLRIICPNWKRTNSHILVDKASFSVSQDNLYIKGKLMVRNLALDKFVSIRYTFDHWSSTNEVDATFFGPNPKNVTFDIYDFLIYIGNGQLADRGEIRGKIQFGIRVTAGTRDYYDDNQGHYYKIKIIADPLNKEQYNIDEYEQEDDYPTEEEEQEEMERHNQFTNALKGYQHAKPLYLKKNQQLFLATRYNFNQSLSEAKKSSISNHNDELFPKPFIKPSSPPPDHIHILDNMYIPTATTETITTTTITTTTMDHHDDDNNNTAIDTNIHADHNDNHDAVAAATPPASPTLPSSIFLLSPASMDINSSHYLDLLKKYCFYNSDQNEP